MRTIILDRVNAIMHKFNYNDLQRIRKRIPKKAVKAFDDVVEVMESNFKDRWDIKITSTLSRQIRTYHNVYGYYYGYEWQRDPLWLWERSWLDYVTRKRRSMKSNMVIIPMDISEYAMPRLEVTKLEVSILYPKIVIRNSKGTSRELLDMVVSVELTLDNDNWTITAFRGSRLTFTAGEYFAGYMHSHLGRMGMFEGPNRALKFTNFCTGGGEIKMLEMGYNTHNSLEAFEAFILMIEPYLSWESLEGGPYIHMDNTFMDREVDLAHPRANIYTRATNLFSSLWSTFSNRYNEIDPVFLEVLKWELTSEGYKILVTEDLMNYYKAKVGNDAYVIVGEGNKLYEYRDSIGTINTASVNARAHYFNWRGAILRAKIVDDIPQHLMNIPEEKIIVHPLIIKHVNSKFEAIINNQITDEIATRKVSKSRDTKRSSPQDQVSLW